MGLFGSKEEKAERNELEKKVKTILKKFELGDLHKLCQSTIGKEIEPWRKKGDEYEKKGQCYQDYHPVEKSEYEDFIWKYVKKNEIAYEQIQDFAIRHSIVPRYYFEDSGKNPRSQNTRRGWNEQEKEEVRIRQDGKCYKCGRPPPRWEYHHSDGNHNNNSLINCEGLCPNCHSVKTHD